MCWLWRRCTCRRCARSKPGRRPAREDIYLEKLLSSSRPILRRGANWWLFAWNWAARPGRRQVATWQEVIQQMGLEPEAEDLQTWQRVEGFNGEKRSEGSS